MHLDQYFRRASVLKVVDGDTIDCVLDLGWHLSLTERIRLSDVDAPEIRGQERHQGLRVKRLVVQWCESQPFVWVHSERYQVGKYGRTLGTIYSATQDQELNHLVREWSEIERAAK